MSNTYNIHVGDYYAEIVLPSGGVFTLKYPDAEDIAEINRLEKILKELNNE